MADQVSGRPGDNGSGDAHPPVYSRRRLLATSAAAALSGAAAVAVGGGFAVARTRDDAAGTPTTAGGTRSAGGAEAAGATVPFDGPHQAGVRTPAQAFAAFCAFDLRPEVDAAALRRLLRLLSDDIARMTTGTAALADTAPELAAAPARLTVTVGFGPTLFDKVGLTAARPAGFADLPSFPEIDRLDPAYGGADLVLQICADDPLVVAHAQRMLFKDTRAFATARWTQRGFLPMRPDGATPRNLMGQVDGTVNPSADADVDRLVWYSGDDWFRGGTFMVLRRIRMELDTWDELDPSAMEATVGRRLSNGAPLTGTVEHDEPDLAALDATGLPAIADFAHLRVARGDGPALQILRRPYNFDDSPGPDGGSDLGLLFCAYQADVTAQFVPMQRRLADGDLLNQWTTPVGSAVFAVPPRFSAGGFVGEGMYT